MLRAPALTFILKPNLHGTRCHTQLLGQVQTLVRGGEESLFKDLVKPVDLVGGGTLALGFDAPGIWG